MLTKEQRQELEKMGQSLIALLFHERCKVDPTGNKFFLSPENNKVLRSDVEEWLAEKEREGKTLERTRFKTQLRWNIATFFIALIGAIIAIAQYFKN